MKVDTNWEIYSTKHEIEVGKLSDPCEIADLFRQYSIEKYVYRIKHNGIVIKFGMSCPKANTARNGDRLYRQIGHNSSWQSKRLTGSSGADWRIIEEDFFNLHGVKIDHRFIRATVWDLTNYPFKTIDPFYEVNAIENELIERYISITGEKPIGNINDEANVKKKSLISTELMDSLFDWRFG
jgi:hypothetical protein